MKKFLLTLMLMAFMLPLAMQAQTCVVPDSLTVNDEYVVAWRGTADNYIVRVTMGEVAADSTIDTNVYAIEIAEFDTLYVSVRAICSANAGDTSDWSETLTVVYATPEVPDDSCYAPTALAVNDGVVTWEGDASIYNLQITINDSTINESVDTNAYTIEGLVHGDSVTVKVQAVCDSAHSSDWTETEFVYDTVVPVEPCAVPTNVVVANGIVTWEGTADAYNVEIAKADTTITVAVEGNTYTIEGLEEGDSVIVKVQAACDSANLSEWSEPVTYVHHITGIPTSSIRANLFPNPTTGNVTVESNAIGADITVFDMFGKQMMTSKVAADRTELNFSSFAPGIYMVRIADTTGTTTVKVVKK